MSSLEQRAVELDRFAFALEREQEAIVSTLVRELEMTRSSAMVREVQLPAAFLREHGSRALPQLYDDPVVRLGQRRPIGRVAIMPPQNAIGMAASAMIASAYLTGNEVVLRLPSRATGLAAIYRPLIVNHLSGITVVDQDGPGFLRRCFQDPLINAVCLFGDDRWFVPYGRSPVSGLNYREIARLSETKVVFEGPGKDPFVVCRDANIQRAAAGAVAAGYANNGQSCSSPERFYVHEDVLELFTQHVLARVARLRVGSPNLAETEIGPIRSVAVRERITRQFEDARQKGAVFLAGGEFVQHRDCTSPTCLPTVVGRCTHDMSLLREETFGPVIPIVSFQSEEELIEMVNDSEYGLTATVYGGSESLQTQLQLSHGRVFVDSCIVDPEHALCRLFWGGFRNSGWVWERTNGNFVHREGPRRMLAELAVL